MKNYKFKVSHILAITTVSAAMMAVTTTLNDVSTVHADAVSNSSLVKTNSQAGTNDNIITGTWGTAPWTWNKTTGELTIDGGTLGSAEKAPWFNENLGELKQITFTDKINLPKDSSNLFHGLFRLEHLNGMNNFDTSNVTDMSGIFDGDNNLESLNVSTFDTSKVTNMSSMFADDLEIKSLDLSSFDTSKVTNMSEMIYNNPKLSYLNISNFDTSKVTDMTRMLCGHRSLDSIDVSKFDTSKVTNMSGMFDGDDNLKNLDISNFDTSNVTNMYRMFANTHFDNLDISNFDTSKVTNMSGMFHSASGLKNLNLSNFDTSKVTDMSHMFDMTYDLVNLNISSFDTSNVTNMSSMFASYSFDANYINKLKKLDISNFDMSNVDESVNMFWKSRNLNTLILGKKNKFVSHTVLTTALPKVPTTDGYQGKWQNVKDSNGNNVNNGETYTSDDLLTNYTPDRAGTYVWAKENKDISDLTELYNKVKYSISYSGDVFNSQPGNSMKYKNEFNDKTMFGAMDYAYNSKDYDGLVKLMHDSIKKTHESIGSLQVNEAKAKELGLNVDQLKADLAKDSVPYDYSQDNDIDGINKQLDSFASVRAKYNKLVQQGVFDKSDYWTMNK